MVILFLIFANLCFGLAFAYLVFSVFSALKVGRRHYQSLIFLEFQPGRARGNWEVSRAKLMKRIQLWAILGMLVGIASLVGYLFAS